MNDSYVLLSRKVADMLEQTRKTLSISEIIQKVNTTNSYVCPIRLAETIGIKQHHRIKWEYQADSGEYVYLHLPPKELIEENIKETQEDIENLERFLSGRLREADRKQIEKDKAECTAILKHWEEISEKDAQCLYQHLQGKKL